LAVARIALTFVTFASIVSLLRHAPGQWLYVEVMGLKLMFEFDLAATFFALIPFPVLYTVGLRHQEVIWRICILLLLAYLTYAFQYHFRTHKKAASKPRHTGVFLWLFTIPMALIIPLEIAGFIWRPSLAFYLWGLLWLLIPPVVQFSLFIRHFGLKPSGETTNIITPDP